jgi:hypothetical protein
MADENMNEKLVTEARTRMLRFICFLTFAWRFNTFAQAMVGIFHAHFSSMSVDNFKEFSFSEMQIKMISESIELIRTGGRLYFIINAALFVMSFFGAVRMWKLKRSGFHLYTIAQILLLIIPLVFIRNIHLPGMNIILTAVFILTYSTFLKIMH